MEKPNKLPEAKNMVDPTELSDEELEETTGGIIIVSGRYVTLGSLITSPLSRVALNPQPLPPKVLYR